MNRTPPTPKNHAEALRIIESVNGVSSDALRLIYEHGVTVGEAALMVGVTRENVQQQLRLALRRLKIRRKIVPFSFVLAARIKDSKQVVEQWFETTDAPARGVRPIKCYVVTRKCGHAETYPAIPYESAVKMTKSMCQNCAMESPQ